MNHSVLKFGGTSMGSAESLQQVASIIVQTSRTRLPIIVVSAVSGTTNLLEKHFNHDHTALGTIIEMHEQIISELNIETDLSPFYEEIRNTQERDALLAIGEQMSSHLLSCLLTRENLHQQRILSTELIFTDNNYGEGLVDFKKTNKATNQKLTPLLNEECIPLITGFFGQSTEGKTILLGRGGSDYSAAIIAAAINADRLEIWTDVNGIYSADPRIIPQAQAIPSLSFSEAAELAYFGAKVLHPKTIIPAIHKHIPVYVKNTFNPSAAGTCINHEENQDIKAISWRDDATIISICSSRMLEAHGFLAKIFALFAQHQISVDVLATSEVSVSLTINQKPPHKLIEELETFSTVSVLSHYSIICLVGSGINAQHQVLKRLFNALEKVEVKMLSQGASQRNITLLVANEDRYFASNRIFDEFLSHSLTPQS